MLTAPFRKGERRYSMSKGIRSAWPKLERLDDVGIQYNFTFLPDDSQLLKIAYKELVGRISRREQWTDSGDIKPDKGSKHRRTIIDRYKPKHDKSNISKYSYVLWPRA
jgi:hypothetical protein